MVGEPFSILTHGLLVNRLPPDFIVTLFFRIPCGILCFEDHSTCGRFFYRTATFAHSKIFAFINTFALCCCCQCRWSISVQRCGPFAALAKNCARDRGCFANHHICSPQLRQAKNIFRANSQGSCTGVATVDNRTAWSSPHARCSCLHTVERQTSLTFTWQPLGAGAVQHQH